MYCKNAVHWTQNKQVSFPGANYGSLPWFYSKKEVSFSIPYLDIRYKVHIFFEGHKILQNLHQLFD